MVSSEQVGSCGDIPGSSNEKLSAGISGTNRILSMVYFGLCDSGNPSHPSDMQTMLKSGALIATEHLGNTDVDYVLSQCCRVQTFFSHLPCRQMFPTGSGGGP